MDPEVDTWLEFFTKSPLGQALVLLTALLIRLVIEQISVQRKARQLRHPKRHKPA